MLILPKKDILQKHVETREGMTNHFNKEMERILNENSNVEKYWILGRVNVEHKHGKEIVRPFLQACLEKPGLIKKSFVYEVDNTKGTKTLLWVFHAGDTLNFPTLGKSIRVASEKGTTILPPEIGRT